MKRLLLATAVLGLLPSLGCWGHRSPKKAVLIEQGAPTMEVDFSSVIEQRVWSSTFYAGKEPGLMRRLLLSPNLVFESSRSTVEEAKTWGPVTAGNSTPSLEYALGEPVDMHLSAMMMAHLSSSPRNSILLAPALMKRWDPKFWCAGTKDCVEASWVERLILMQQKPPASVKEVYVPEVRPEELPSCALAVRRLNISDLKFEVVVERRKGGFLFRPALVPGETSPECGRAAPIEIPMVQLQAEFVSMRDGRLLARVDETRSPQLDRYFRQQIPARFKVPPELRYSSVKPEEYQRRKTCEAAMAAYEGLRAQLRRDRSALTSAAAAELFRSAIDPLYSSAPAPTISLPPAAAAPQTPAPVPANLAAPGTAGTNAVPAATPAPLGGQPTAGSPAPGGTGR